MRPSRGRVEAGPNLKIAVTPSEAGSRPGRGRVEAGPISKIAVTGSEAGSRPSRGRVEAGPISKIADLAVMPSVVSLSLFFSSLLSGLSTAYCFRIFRALLPLQAIQLQPCQLPQCKGEKENIIYIYLKIFLIAFLLPKEIQKHKKDTIICAQEKNTILIFSLENSQIANTYIHTKKFARIVSQKMCKNDL